MTSMRRDDVIWTAVVTLIAVTINPILKVLGLLPADVFQNLGIFLSRPAADRVRSADGVPAARLVPEDRQSHGLSSDRIPARAVAELRIPGQRGAQRYLAGCDCCGRGSGTAAE